MSLMDTFYSLQNCPLGSIPYFIQPGDTFYRIAQRLGTTVATLISLNPNVNPNNLQIGQSICVPGSVPSVPPTLIPTPLCSLLQPVTENIPSEFDIPMGSVTVRQIAMSTRAYTIVVSPLPNPSFFGNFDSYIGDLSLITDDPANPRVLVEIRLIPTGFEAQPITWAGSTITVYPPILGDFGEVRPLNTRTGAKGPIILRGELSSCQLT